METHFDNVSKARSIYIYELHLRLTTGRSQSCQWPQESNSHARLPTNPLAEQTHAPRELESRELNRTAVPLSPNLSHPYQNPQKKSKLVTLKRNLSTTVTSYCISKLRVGEFAADDSLRVFRDRSDPVGYELAAGAEQDGRCRKQRKWITPSPTFPCSFLPSPLLIPRPDSNSHTLPTSNHMQSSHIFPISVKTPVGECMPPQEELGSNLHSLTPTRLCNAMQSTNLP